MKPEVSDDYSQTPEGEIRKTALYHTVFYEMLVDSPNPRADLEALGVSGDLARFAGTNTYMPNSGITYPWFQAAFFDKVSLRHVLQFYLTHPSRFWQRIKKSASQGFILKANLGHYDKESGLPPFSQGMRFRLWSDFRQRALPGSPWTLLIIWGGSLVASTLLYFRRQASAKERLGLMAFGTLNVMAVVAFLTCTLGDSLYDLVRHLFAFHAMIDLSLLIGIVWLVEVGVRAARERNRDIVADRPMAAAQASSS